MFFSSDPPIGSVFVNNVVLAFTSAFHVKFQANQRTLQIEIIITDIGTLYLLQVCQTTTIH